jgi:hypothetical protein
VIQSTGLPFLACDGHARERTDLALAFPSLPHAGICRAEADRPAIKDRFK